MERKVQLVVTETSPGPGHIQATAEIVDFLDDYYKDRNERLALLNNAIAELQRDENIRNNK